MAKQQRTRTNPGIALIAAALTLAAGAVAFAAPQATSPVPPPAPSPAPTAQPDKPATPAAVPPSVASLIAQARVGDAQMAAKEYDAAIATYLTIIPQVTERGQGDLWAHIGEAYRIKGDYPSSIQAFEKAFALVPTDPRVASNLGVLYESQKD